jgi:antitoxin VapB
MKQVAKVFQCGRNQAVRLPVAIRFDTAEVFVRLDPKTGDVILSERPFDWEGLFRATEQAKSEASTFLTSRGDGLAQARAMF